MNKRTLWIATGTLGVMAIGAGSAVADSAFENEDLGQSIVQATEAPALSPVMETSVSPAAVNLDQHDVKTAVSAVTAQSAASPASAQSAPSPVSAQSAASPASAQSAPSPVSAQSAASAPSAQSAD
ncbi:hypothetical protein [Arthrobacter sulfonylureivorans]|uniref:Uncharacterized protein n=1 Tax=Arthrobacter sulfonylureivorans TaxID=2486855 RepID=A0ABY3W593_9MICC|nr:hypothetical protein [Arthrobacter sulfonylureivorans]UNK45111.1 hypothetical protein MNQ99_14350 [Arthrobacter sulfonylureivorans]